MKRLLILGVNGFIGHHLSRAVLERTDWHVYGMDLGTERLAEVLGSDRFHFVEGDITINREWIEYHIKKCDIVMPLVAIATPKTYVERPLDVFELDFEANLEIVRRCAHYGKRLVFPSTSEVYGMCPDPLFKEDASPLVTGPICKERWIYSSAKQLLDRVIWASGKHRGLRFTLFRPFNWIGPRLDSLETAKEGSSRVVTQFIASMLKRDPIMLVDGGSQRRCFTDIRDGIDALMAILLDEKGACNGRIFNIGNPGNDCSVRELANQLQGLFRQHPDHAGDKEYSEIREVHSREFYGEGYQDIMTRTPDITAARTALGWEPKIGLTEALKYTLNAFLDEAKANGGK